jgi:hypothetical protein
MPGLDTTKAPAAVLISATPLIDLHYAKDTIAFKGATARRVALVIAVRRRRETLKI